MEAASALMSSLWLRENQRDFAGEVAGVSTVPQMSKQDAIGSPLRLASFKQHCQLAPSRIDSTVQTPQKWEAVCWVNL